MGIIMSKNKQEINRIVKINSFEMLITADYLPNRRNLVCRSNALSKYTKENNLCKDNYNHIVLIHDMIYDNKFDDIEVIKVKGFY